MSLTREDQIWKTQESDDRHAEPNRVGGVQRPDAAADRLRSWLSGNQGRREAPSPEMQTEQLFNEIDRTA